MLRLAKVTGGATLAIEGQQVVATIADDDELATQALAKGSTTNIGLAIFATSALIGVVLLFAPCLVAIQPSDTYAQHRKPSPQPQPAPAEPRPSRYPNQRSSGLTPTAAAQLWPSPSS